VFGQLTRDMGGTVTGMLSLGGIIGTTSAIWNSHLQEMKDKSDALRKSVESLEDVLARQGKIAELPAIRKKLAEMAHGKLTRGEMEVIDTSVRGAVGDRADEATIESADRAGVRATTARMKSESAAQFAKVYAQVAMINQHAGKSMAETGSKRKNWPIASPKMPARWTRCAAYPESSTCVIDTSPAGSTGSAEAFQF
jgi:hypothetical protein